MARIESNPITVPADVAEQVHNRLAGGQYATDGDVLRDAMHALEQKEKLRALRAMVEASINDPRPSLTDEELSQRLQRRAAELRSARGEHA